MTIIEEVDRITFEWIIRLAEENWVYQLKKTTTLPHVVANLDLSNKFKVDNA